MSGLERRKIYIVEMSNDDFLKKNATQLSCWLERNHMFQFKHIYFELILNIILFYENKNRGPMLW